MSRDCLVFVFTPCVCSCRGGTVQAPLAAKNSASLLRRSYRTAHCPAAHYPLHLPCMQCNPAIDKNHLSECPTSVGAIQKKILVFHTWRAFSKFVLIVTKGQYKSRASQRTSLVFVTFLHNLAEEFGRSSVSCTSFRSNKMCQQPTPASTIPSLC